MEDITDEEFMAIMDYLNKHTSPQETLQIETRRATDASWDAKIRRVEEMRFKQRYAEARQALQPVFEQPLVAETRVVSFWKNTPAWLSAASVALLLGGAYWGYQYVQKNDTVAVRPSADSTHANSDKTTETPTPSLSEMVSIYINQPLEVPKIPESLTQEIKGINDESARPKTIRTLETLVGDAQRNSSSLPNDISYGSGLDTLSSFSADSLRGVAQKNAYQQFILGVGYLKNKQPQKALKTLLSIHEPFLSQELSWYKALIYLQLGSPKKARAELLTLSQDPYKTDAQKLLAMLP